VSIQSDRNHLLLYFTYLQLNYELSGSHSRRSQMIKTKQKMSKQECDEK